MKANRLYPDSQNYHIALWQNPAPYATFCHIVIAPSCVCYQILQYRYSSIWGMVPDSSWSHGSFEYPSPGKEKKSTETKPNVPVPRHYKRAF